MAWKDAVITADGLKLLNECVFGGAVEITQAAGGERASPDGLSENISAIPGENHQIQITGITRLKQGVSVSLRLHNHGLKKGYWLRQIGIFAKIKESPSPPVLLALIQDNVGEEIPAESENPEYLLEYTLVLPISNKANVTAVLSPNIFATLDDLNAHTHPAMTGATPYLKGEKGFVPTPEAGEHEKFLRGDGTWQYVPKTHEFASGIRDKSKPDYGYKPSGNFMLLIETADYTGTAEVAILREDNTLVDAKNITRNTKNVPDGTFIITEE